MKKILIPIFILMSSFQVSADNLSDSNALFKWAEEKYPEYFNPSGTETFEIQNYLARRYSKNTYLGTQSTNVFVYTPLLFKGKVTKVGVISDFIDVYNQGEYDQAKKWLSQDEEYQTLRENSIKDATEADLGEDFVNDLEEKLLKLLTTSSDHQVDIIRTTLNPLVDKKVLLKAEQQAIVTIYSDLINGESEKAEETLAIFKQTAVSDLGELMASELQGFVDASSVDQQASSNGENWGAAGGAILGGAAGFFVGGGTTVGTGAIPAAGVGAFIGSALGKAIGGSLDGGGDGPDEGDGDDNGDTGGDSGDTGGESGGDTGG